MINFEKENDTEYLVKVDDNVAGHLVFDSDQDVWLFESLVTTNSNVSNDSVQYESNLTDSMRELQDDFEIGKNDSNVAYFGSYKYE